MSDSDFKISSNVENAITKSIKESRDSGASLRVLGFKAIADGLAEHMEDTAKPLTRDELEEGLKYYYKDSLGLDCEDVVKEVLKMYVREIKVNARKGLGMKLAQQITILRRSIHH